MALWIRHNFRIFGVTCKIRRSCKFELAWFNVPNSGYLPTRTIPWTILDLDKVIRILIFQSRGIQIWVTWFAIDRHFLGDFDATLWVTFDTFLGVFFYLSSWVQWIGTTFWVVLETTVIWVVNLDQEYFTGLMRCPEAWLQVTLI